MSILHHIRPYLKLQQHWCTIITLAIAITNICVMSVSGIMYVNYSITVSTQSHSNLILIGNFTIDMHHY